MPSCIYIRTRPRASCVYIRQSTHSCVITYTYIEILHHVLEMQRYIDILPYRDTLGSDTVSIHI